MPFQVRRGDSFLANGLENHGREVQEQIRLRTRGVADTKAAHAAIASARLKFREAAVLYGEAASLVAPFDAEAHKNWLSAQGDELYFQGEQFGDNAALVEAFDIYQHILTLTPRGRVPLDWAATQHRLGTALMTLEKRGSGTGRLEEAVAFFREAQKVWTRALSASMGDDAEQSRQCAHDA